MAICHLHVSRNAPYLPPKILHNLCFSSLLGWVVIKSRWPGISPGYYECGPQLLLLENRRKLEPKEIPSCFTPRLLVVFTWQLEILVTTLLLGIYTCLCEILFFFLWGRGGGQIRCILGDVQVVYSKSHKVQYPIDPFS